MPLPRTVHFVCSGSDRWADLFAAANGAEYWQPDDLDSRIVANEDSCVVLTYLRLRRRGEDVRLSREFVPGEINVACGINFGVLTRTQYSFVVACRTDGFDPALADYKIVHNPAQVRGRRSSHIPTWPQPGLVPRDQARGTTIRNVVFKGDLRNLEPEFRGDRFLSALGRLGVELVVDGKPEDESTGRVAWNDYSTADLMLAVRNLRVREAAYKPSIKLVNAWTAGIPALLGPEPAYRQLRRGPDDYLEVTSTDEALRAIEQLQDDPDRYRRIVAGGLERAKDFSDEATTQRWVDVLSGPVASRYDRWRGESRARRDVRFGVRALLYRRAKAAAERSRTHGPRLLS